MAALEHFVSIKSDNKIAVLGDMLELGSKELEEHQTIIDYVNKHNLKTIFIGAIYNKCKIVNSNLHFSNTEKLIEFITQNPIENQTILLKASRGIKLENIVKYL